MCSESILVSSFLAGLKKKFEQADDSTVAFETGLRYKKFRFLFFFSENTPFGEEEKSFSRQLGINIHVATVWLRLSQSNRTTTFQQRFVPKYRYEMLEILFSLVIILIAKSFVSYLNPISHISAFLAR